MYKLTYSFILIILISFSAYSQRLKQFSDDPEIFLQELESIFDRDASRADLGKDLIETMEEAWLNGGYTKQNQEEIIHTSNLLLKRGARNFPHFYDYIKSVIEFRDANIDSLNYKAWQNAIQFMCTESKAKISHIHNFNKGIYYLVTENAIYHSGSVKWYTNNTNYSIKILNDTVLIKFPKITLKGKLRQDSIEIHETSGTYYPINNAWVGDSAKVYWEKTGLNRNLVWAEFGNYTINLGKASYTIPNVKFSNQYYFDYQLEGTLTDKIVEAKNPSNLSYPRFVSNQKHFEIKNIFQDINYRGGFSMQGGKLVGTGSDKANATLTLLRDVELVVDDDTVIEKQVFMRTESQYYAFTEREITSSNCKISMRIDKDSIYHPGLLFRYYDNNREVNLIRDDNPENMSRSPYYNTYHKVEMNFELLKWQMYESDIDLTMLRGTSINIAQFESQDFFNAKRFYEVRGFEQVHPYYSIRRFVRANNSEIIHEEDLAKYMGYPLTPIKRMLIDFTYRGIVDYDSETGYATVKPKLYKYCDAIVGKRDYDLINFESRTNAPRSNAVLNLKNMDLAIQGVPVVNVSDSQNVLFYPKNQEILLKKNRDFDFAGRLEVGYFNYYGDNFQFKYDSFKVALNQVDSLSIKVKAGVDNWGRLILANVENVIENVTGDVIIDEPDNKSGIKSNPHYPIFNSEKESFVYYDAKNIQDGKYIRDRFYFKVDPYKIDSLNNFSPEGMGYDGDFFSADIFPNFRQRLVLQKDFSLGFHHDTPEEGFPLYKGKGHYFDNIHMSNAGLRGDGTMTYLTSTTMSQDFIFYPDSTNATSTKFDIRKQVAAAQYPKVTVDEIYMHWMPYDDELYSNTIEEPYNMYENKSKHLGNLLYTPSGLTGKGTSYYYKGELSSELMNFNADKFSADTANFKLNSVNADKLALSTTNVNAKVDFIAMESKFKSNQGTSKAELAENLYHAYIEQFDWKMLDETMQFNTPNTVQVFEYGETRIVERESTGSSPIGSLFISIHKGQDSLNWVSPVADFDLKTNIINAHQVKFIEVADATVYPNEGEVTIKPMAYMETLKDAEVLANMETKYHRFHDALINISGRKKYHGQGKYNYIDDQGKAMPINFDMIAVDSNINTFARGSVSVAEDFSLSPAFKYRGKVYLFAQEPLLRFDGYTQIDHECNEAFSENWLRFDSKIDPQNVLIPLDEQPKDINEAFLVSGTMLATDSIHIFPTFISPRKRYSNVPVMTSGGFLKFNNKDKTYNIADTVRLAHPDTTGNFLSLHKNFCTMYGEGNIDLTTNLGQIKVETKGNGLYKLNEDKFNLNLLMSVDFFFPEACIQFIADTLASMTALKPINLQSRTYTQGLKELIPYNTAQQMFKEQSIFGTVKKLPDELIKTFVFSDLNLQWNKELDAWQSTSQLGIANILSNQINRKVNGHMLVTRKRSGDSFDLFIEIDEDHWYYFNYKRGLMQAYSSEAPFNEIITSIKGSDRKMKIERGETSYVFFLSNLKKRNDFLKLIGKPVGKKATEEEDNDDEDEDYEQYDEFD